jgi:hypothetical protein
MEKEPYTEEPELEPGGPDAVPEDEDDWPPVGRDLPPELHPHDDRVPDAIQQPDEKSQEPEDEPSGEGPTNEEPPA